MKEQKKYKVIRDCQGGEFGMGRNYTIEQWREQAIEWADSDENDGLIRELKKLPKKEIIDTISEIWQLEFAECLPQFAFQYHNENDNTDLYFLADKKETLIDNKILINKYFELLQKDDDNKDYINYMYLLKFADITLVSSEDYDFEDLVDLNDTTIIEHKSLKF